MRELINWENSKDKEVIDLQGNQDILVQALESLLDEIGTNSILLDGHFCLLTCSGCIQEVPLSTFINMNPSLIIVISADEEVVKNRLKTRDNKDYDIDFLREFQSCEKEYAKQVASVLKLPCFILTADESDLLLDIINPYI
nr:ATP-binding protein [Porphyromonas somerae]